MEWITGGKELLGLLLALIAFLGVLGRWFWAKVSNRVKSDFSGLTTGHADIQMRLERVETDQTALRGDMRRVEGHLSTLENRMGSLSTKQDVTALAIGLAEVKATGLATSQMVDSLYRGVVARADRNS